MPRVTAFNLRPGDDLAAPQLAIDPAASALRPYPIEAAGWVSR